MSSATAWTRVLQVCLFVSLTAHCSKLLWQQLQRSCLRNSWMLRWTVSVLVSAERNCLARASVTSCQSSARYPGAWPDKDRLTSVAILNTTRWQWSWRSSGEICSDLLAPVTNLAAAFCTDCRRQDSSFVMPKTEHYNSPGNKKVVFVSNHHYHSPYVASFISSVQSE